MRISDWSSDVCSSDLKAIGVTLAELRRIGKAKHRSVVAGGGNQPGIEAVPVFHPVGYGAGRGRIVFERYRTGHDIRRVDLRDCCRILGRCGANPDHLMFTGISFSTSAALLA